MYRRRADNSQVGWMIALKESAELAEQLIADSVAKQDIEPGTLLGPSRHRYPEADVQKQLENVDDSNCCVLVARE